MGVATTRYKVTAFCGLVRLQAWQVRYMRLTFTLSSLISFGFMKSIDILIIVVFGGLGSLSGSLWRLLCWLLSQHCQSFSI